MNTKMSEETKIPESEKPAPDGQFNLDGILSELGSFGKYQLLLLLLLSFRDSFLAMCNFNYVLTANDVPFRCHIPECENLSTINFNASWTSFAIPNETHCLRMAPYYRLEGNNSSHNNQWMDNHTVWSSQRCDPAKFDKIKTMNCEKIVYEDYNSLVAEFDLGCQPWKRTLIGTVHNLGLVFSHVISGFISDRYGRKVIIVLSPLVVGVVGLLKSFSFNYWMLLVLEFVESSLGYGTASMVLSLEAVTQKRRVIFSCISDILSSFGSSFFGLIAWKIPYWRHLLRAIYAPLLVAVFYIFLVDEGVRWLLAHNRNDEAVRVLNKVAKVNNITLSSKAKDMLAGLAKEQYRADEINPERKQDSIRIYSVLKSRIILVRAAIMSACWVCALFVYNGAFVNAASISGNKYLNISAVLLVSVPTRVITAVTLTRFGRKIPMCIAYSLCAVFFVMSAFVPKSVGWASLLLYLAGKMCSSYGMFTIFVVTMEVFPTTSRNALTSLVNTIGRIGSVLAPQTPLLEHYMSGLPSIVFGLAAFGPALLALLLPDTSQAALPDDVTEAENLDYKPEEEKKCQAATA